MPSTGLAHREICAALRGERIRSADPMAFAQAAVDEAVVPLLMHAGIVPDLPGAATAVLQAELHRQLALTAVRESELRRVLSLLAEDGVDVLVIKGAHLAHAFYAEPVLRPRQDADLLVRPAHRRAATHTLARLGYVQQPAITGPAVQGQTIFERPDVPAAILDVHWRIASPIVAAELFDFDLLWRDAEPVPSLGPGARAPHVLDAVAIAAVHLLAHHAHEVGLLWLFDLRVLADTLTAADVQRLSARARERRMSAICAAALRLAEDRFPTAAGSALLAALKADRDEPSAALLEPRRRSAQAFLDVRTLNGWRARATYVAGHLFPPAAYMRRRYAPGSRAPLAWLYARRILTGATKWL